MENSVDGGDGLQSLSNHIISLPDGSSALLQTNPMSSPDGAREVHIVQSFPSDESNEGLEEAFHQCPVDGCKQSFITQGTLLAHQRASHDESESTFICPHEDCAKTFKNGYNLRLHLRVHSQKRPFKCPEKDCTKSYKYKSDLSKHQRIHTGERPFVCSVESCKKAFMTSHALTIHTRLHTGEKPYVCNHCGHAVATMTNYKNHLRTHTGERPFKCPVEGCNKAFAEYSSLYKHQIVHTSEKPYECKECGKKYRQSSTLNTHYKATHAKQPRTAQTVELAIISSSEISRDTRLTPLVVHWLGDDTAVKAESPPINHSSTTESSELCCDGTDSQAEVQITQQTNEFLQNPTTL